MGFQEFFVEWQTAFLDPKGLEQVSEFVLGDSRSPHQSVEETITSHFVMFARDLTAADSPWLEKVHDTIESYLKQFDVKPNSPDAIKYAWALGVEMCRHAESCHAVQPLHLAVIRVNVIRTLVGLAVLSMQLQKRSLSKTSRLIAKKLMHTWKGDDHAVFYGMFGTYTAIKLMASG